MNYERVLDYQSPHEPLLEKESFISAETHKDILQQYVEGTLLDKPEPHDREFLMNDIAGFSPTRTVAKYLDISERLQEEYVTQSEINRTFAELVRKDLEAYAAEFLYRRPVLQTEYEIRNINGFPELVSPKYDPHSPLHTHISLKEREGAVFDGVVNLEHALIAAQNHTTVLYGSSEGWNGTGAPFHEGQMHVVNVVDNQIIDTTLRVSLGLSNFKKLIEGLSGEPLDETNEKELIKHISRTVIAIPADITPESILDQMEKIVQTETAWKRMKLEKGTPTLDKIFTFDEIRTVLRQNNYLATNTEVKNVISELSDYLETHSDASREALAQMVREIGKAALTIAESIGIEQGELHERKIKKGDYSGATKYASEGMGCDTLQSSSKLEAQYAKEGIDGTCTQCGEYTKTICGWCMNCAEAGGNYKKIQQEKMQKGYEPLLYDKNVGSFLGIIIAGVIISFSNN